jgi:hypothetical protein
MILQNVCWLPPHYVALFARDRNIHTHYYEKLKSNNTRNIAFVLNTQPVVVPQQQYDISALSLVWCLMLSEYRMIRYIIWKFIDQLATTHSSLHFWRQILSIPFAYEHVRWLWTWLASTHRYTHPPLTHTSVICGPKLRYIRVLCNNNFNKRKMRIFSSDIVCFWTYFSAYVCKQHASNERDIVVNLITRHDRSLNWYIL